MNGRDGMADMTEDTTTMNAPPRRLDAGMTLIELVVTIVLMGTVVLALVGAVQATVTVSSRGRTAAEMETLLVNIADRINRADWQTSCDYSAYAKAAASTKWGATVVASNPNLVQTTSRVFIPPTKLESPQFISRPGQWIESTTCNEGRGDIVRVTVQVQSPDGRVHRQIEVVKKGRLQS